MTSIPVPIEGYQESPYGHEGFIYPHMETGSPRSHTGIKQTTFPVSIWGLPHRNGDTKITIETGSYRSHTGIEKPLITVPIRRLPYGNGNSNNPYLETGTPHFYMEIVMILILLPIRGLPKVTI
jgi:hypothetical protein